MDQGDTGSVGSTANRGQNGIRCLPHGLNRKMKNGRDCRNHIDLSASAAVLLLIDVPPSPRAERHFIKKVFIVVAASLLRSARRRRHRALPIRLLFVPHWGSGHLTY